MTREEFYSLKTPKKKKKMIEMSEEKFDLMLKEAGLTKKDFLSIIGCYEHNLYRWAREKQYPPYIKTILEWAIKAKKYKNKIDELENSSNFEENKDTDNFDILKKHNLDLKEKINSYKELQKLYTELFL